MIVQSLLNRTTDPTLSRRTEEAAEQNIPSRDRLRQYLPSLLLMLRDLHSVRRSPEDDDMVLVSIFYDSRF